LDRAGLETDNDDDASFSPTEPASFSPRLSRPSAAEHTFFNSPPKSLAPEFASLPVPPMRTASPERLAFAKRLFVGLFGALTLLLAYALLRHF
jgi:hypothetical protein